MANFFAVRSGTFVGLALVLGTLAGCGGGSGDVSGKVTYQGKPVVSGSVTFYGSNKEAFVGAIDEQGNYQVRGVPAGTAHVVVSSPDPAAVVSQMPLNGKAPKPTGGPDAAVAPPSKSAARPTGWRALPQQYGDVATSKLTFDVTSGDNIYDIKLD
jgi:hypothetical protein